MAKEILLYGGVYDFSAERFINQVESAKSQDITLRINSDGGDPESSYGMIAKFRDHPKKTLVKIDGKAHSTALYFAIAANEVEALNVSTGVLHRAAYPEWVERNSDLMTESRVSVLKKINDDLRSIVESNVDVDKLESISGVSLDDLFSLENRIDVRLSAEQMESVGIVNTVKSLTPEIQSSINSFIDIAIAAEYGEKHVVDASKNDEFIKENKKKNNKMTIENLQAEHPALYAQVVNVGVSQEKDRVEAILAYSDIDMKACKDAVYSGEPLSQKFMAEMNVKGMKATVAKEIEEDSAEDVQESGDPEKTKEEQSLEAFNADLKKIQGKTK